MENKGRARVYSAETEERAIELWLGGRSIKEIQVDLGVPRATIYLWIRPRIRERGTCERTRQIKPFPNEGMVLAFTAKFPSYSYRRLSQTLKGIAGVLVSEWNIRSIWAARGLLGVRQRFLWLKAESDAGRATLTLSARTALARDVTPGQHSQLKTKGVAKSL